MPTQTTYIALIRGINVGGHKLVAMETLRDLLGSSGFADARTLLQSGNVVFRSGLRSTDEVERKLAAVCLEGLELDAQVFVRSAAEWDAIVAANPLSAEAERSPKHFIVMFLKEAPAPAQVKAMQSLATGGEVVRANGRELFIAYPKGLGATKFSGAVVERTLGTRGTGRNWNTVLKLQELARA